MRVSAVLLSAFALLGGSSLLVRGDDSTPCQNPNAGTDPSSPYYCNDLEATPCPAGDKPSFFMQGIYFSGIDVSTPCQVSVGYYMRLPPPHYTPCTFLPFAGNYTVTGLVEGAGQDAAAVTVQYGDILTITGVKATPEAYITIELRDPVTGALAAFTQGAGPVTCPDNSGSNGGSGSGGDSGSDNGSGSTTTPPAQGEDNSGSNPPPTPVQDASTGSVDNSGANNGADNNDGSSGVAGSCPYSMVYLNELELGITAADGSVVNSALLPPFNGQGPFRYEVDYGTASLPGATIHFTPGNWTNGATFRVRFNHGDFTYVSAPGQEVDAPLADGSNLIEFDVIQAPCAGDDIQEYSITLFQKAPPSPPPADASTAPAAPPAPPAEASSTGVAAPPSPPSPPSPPEQGGSSENPPPPEMVVMHGQCPALNFTQSITSVQGPPGSPATVVVTWTATTPDVMVEWVDFHVAINHQLVPGGSSAQSPDYNYRMQKQSDSVFTLQFPTGADDVAILATDYLSYFFTSCSMMEETSTDCNSDAFVYNPVAPTPPAGASQEQLPAPGSVIAQCPGINFTANATAPGADTFVVTFENTDTAFSMVSWVDVHLIITSSTINGQFNYRMVESADNSRVFTLTMPTIDTFVPPADATVTYSFTYCVMLDNAGGHLDCNSDAFTTSKTPDQGGLVVGGTGVCPAVDYTASAARSADGSSLTITFAADNLGSDMLEWVDLHVSISSALLADGQGALVPQYNYRMSKKDAMTFSYAFPGADGIAVKPTDYVNFFFTYCDMKSDGSMVDCNTPAQEFGAVSATQAISKTTISNNGNGTSISFNGASSAAPAAATAISLAAGMAAIVLLL